MRVEGRVGRGTWLTVVALAGLAAALASVVLLSQGLGPIDQGEAGNEQGATTPSAAVGTYETGMEIDLSGSSQAGAQDGGYPWTGTLRFRVGKPVVLDRASELGIDVGDFGDFHAVETTVTVTNVDAAPLPTTAATAGSDGLNLNMFDSRVGLAGDADSRADAVWTYTLPTILDEDGQSGAGAMRRLLDSPGSSLDLRVAFVVGRSSGTGDEAREEDAWDPKLDCQLLIVPDGDYEKAVVVRLGTIEPEEASAS